MFENIANISKTNTYEANEMLVSMNSTVKNKIQDVLEHRTGVETFVETQDFPQSNNN